VTITPGETIWTPAGASVNYTVEAQNRDSCGCAPTNFDVSATVPSGWGATNARTPSVVAGGSAVASILVTTPIAVPAGFYPLTLKAANVAALAMAGSASGTVAIDATSTPPPPVTDAGVQTIDAVASTDKSSYWRPRYGSVSAMITTKVTSGGVPVSGASVSVEVRDPGGNLRTLAATTGSAGTTSVAYSIRSYSLRGTYTVTSRATRNGSTDSAGTSFVVN
jgi:NPCBM-associated, NEW3 domain of alpha-galactosidase